MTKVVDKIELFLIPGLGADFRLFEGMAWPENWKVKTLPLPYPKAPAPSLRDYAKQLSNSVTAHSVLLGFSFGGALALEIARWTQPRAIFLVSSFRSEREIPSRFFTQVRWGLLAPNFTIRWLLTNAFSPLFSKVESLDLEKRKLLGAMAKDLDVEFFRWSSRAMADWKASTPAPCPTFKIHGKRDKVIPKVEMKEKDLLLEDGRHLIHWSHGHRLIAFIEDRLREDS